MEKNHLRKATSVIRKNTWYDAIITRNASGLTIRDWCRENGVNETSYYYYGFQESKIIWVPGTLMAETLMLRL